MIKNEQSPKNEEMEYSLNSMFNALVNYKKLAAFFILLGASYAIVEWLIYAGYIKNIYLIEYLFTVFLFLGVSVYELFFGELRLGNKELSGLAKEAKHISIIWLILLTLTGLLAITAFILFTTDRLLIISSFLLLAFLSLTLGLSIYKAWSALSKKQ